MNPLVTIGIPTFNRLAYLKEAVTSALTQTFGNIEILISDDGSTESIRDWSESLAGGEPRVRYRRNARTLGLAGNWNALADAANGCYLVIIGDDDRLLPDFTERLLEAIRPGARVAFANHYLIDSEGARLEGATLQHTRRYRRDSLPGGLLHNPNAVVWQNSIPISAALLTTSDVRRLRFKEDLNTPEIEFFIRLAQEGAAFTFVPDFLAEYRVHNKALTSEGLLGERLAEYLLPISVSPEVELHKREFMMSLLVNAVSRCLQHGKRNSARRFLKSEYYPRASWASLLIGFKGDPGSDHAPLRESSARYFLSGFVQKTCVALPAWIGCPAYRSLQRMKQRLERSTLI